MGDIFEEYSEKDHAELPALTIIQGGGTIRRDESDRALQYDKKSLSNYKKVDVGDFIVHLRSFEGGLEMATNTGIVSPAYHIFHGEKVDSRFYYSYFRSKQFINTDLKPHVYGIRDGRSIDIEGMKTIEIPWTILDEQKAIGNCIDTLDSLITLHQRKLELRFFPGCMFFIWVRMLTWCPATKEQGIAGSEAPRPTGRSPILSRRRGARRRKNKALRGAKHHVQPAEARFCSKDVVPDDERIGHCGKRSTTFNRPKSDFAPKTWCPSTEEQGFAGSEAPRSACGRQPNR